MHHQKNSSFVDEKSEISSKENIKTDGMVVNPETISQFFTSV